MRRGREMEQTAREAVEEKTALRFYPEVIISKEYDWMMASMDGITKDKNIGVEIKCPGETDHNLAQNGMIPLKYKPQLQHQMIVAELEKIFYWSFDGESGVLLEEWIDEEYIKKLMKKEKEFFHNLEEGTAPDLVEKDYMERCEIRWHELAPLEREAAESEKYWKKQKDLIRKEMVEIADGQNSVGGGVKACRYMEKGRVNYNSIPELIGVDVEKYRKEPIYKWRFSFE